MKSFIFFAFLLLLQLELFMAIQVLPVSAATSSSLTSTKLPKATQGRRTSNDVLPPSAFLSPTHYLSTCPNLEAIIQQKVQAWFLKDYTLAASIIRLHFHDCAVRGCDASILLNHKGSERSAKASRTLRGFTVIDDIKAEVERQCPRTVSCADILTAAARDATVLLGGPFWEVPFGRKDGKISISKEADSVPQGRENVTVLIDFFAGKGLDVLDLVVLSGSHTIGRTSCYSILHRLPYFSGSGKPDPSLDPKYLRNLTRECRRGWDFVNLDVTTPRGFDEVYFKNLKGKLGTLSTDQALYSDPRTAPLVEALASQPFLFGSQFAVSMTKLGNVQVLTRPNEGEIRLNCSFVNH